VKEMTLSLFSFRHTSVVTAHTDLHGHTASECLYRSRPLQWCLMYLSRLLDVRNLFKETPLQLGFHFWEQRSNQQVLNLANTDGGRAQSLFVGPKTAWRLSHCGRGRCSAKGTSHQINTRPV